MFLFSFRASATPPGSPAHSAGTPQPPRQQEGSAAAPAQAQAGAGEGDEKRWKTTLEYMMERMEMQGDEVKEAKGTHGNP